MSKRPLAGHFVVVGGGIAGLAAATVLAERGGRVTLLEREAYLGGRAGSWDDTLADGTPFQMERGFHAFFRQYYNLQALLRRVDPALSHLKRLDDYPILGPSGQVQTFSGLPRRTPFNVMELTRRTPTLGLRDLARVNVGRAVQMLTFDAQRTYDRFDTLTAAEFLDSLRFPDDARRLLFDVFAHSFFNPEEDMSAAELLMMFHFYFTGNPEGLVFDVLDGPFSRVLWDPLGRRLEEHGAELRLGSTATALERRDQRWVVHTAHDELVADGVVLALPVEPLRGLVEASPDLDAPTWRESIADLATTRPFAVWRMWLDRPTHGRAPFVGTTGVGILDNISTYHTFEDESAAWAAQTGGSVVELHAYAVDPALSEEEIQADLLAGLHRLYPETRGANCVEERYLLRRDCPAFAPGASAGRPTVATPFPRIALAGDLVKLPFPSALMERAAASGFLAANHFLAGQRPEPVRSVADRGLLAALAR